MGKMAIAVFILSLCVLAGLAGVGVALVLVGSGLADYNRTADFVAFALGFPCVAIFTACSAALAVLCLIGG